MLVFNLKTRLIDIYQFPVSAHTQIVFAHGKPNATNLRIMAGNGHCIALQIAAKHHRPLKSPPSPYGGRRPRRPKKPLQTRPRKHCRKRKKAAPKAIGTAQS